MATPATKITVKLPDGSPLELADGATGADAAAAIGPGLAKAALAITVDGELRDLSAPLPDGAEVAGRTHPRPEAPAPIRDDPPPEKGEGQHNSQRYNAQLQRTECGATQEVGDWQAVDR